jgi:hypothetical protein
MILNKGLLNNFIHKSRKATWKHASIMYGERKRKYKPFSVRRITPRKKSVSMKLLLD